MSGLDNLNKRLKYLGGQQQQERMKMDKLRSLKKALLYSYQAATAILSDEREFRCLINPDKLKNDYENKIISIPFEDIRLNANQKKDKTTQGIEKIDLKCGDIFKWKEDNSYWIVYLRHSEETAYFRAEIRKCKYEIEINSNKYHVYVRGPQKETITWHSRNTDPRVSWNDIDYDLIMYITNNEETRAALYRFAKVEINGKPWEVQAVDDISTDGVIEVALKEDYKDTFKKENDKLKEENDENNKNSVIEGDSIVYPFDEKEYIIKGFTGGYWSISNKKAKIIKSSDTSVKINIISGKSGDFILSYIKNNEEVASLKIIIKSI